MIVLGFVLAILGYWALPELLPECPVRIDNLFGVVGVVFIVIGLGAVGVKSDWPQRRRKALLVLKGGGPCRDVEGSRSHSLRP